MQCAMEFHNILVFVRFCPWIFSRWDVQTVKDSVNFVNNSPDSVRRMVDNVLVNEFKELKVSAFEQVTDE